MTMLTTMHRAAILSLNRCRQVWVWRDADGDHMGLAVPHAHKHDMLCIMQGRTMLRCAPKLGR